MSGDRVARHGPVLAVVAAGGGIGAAARYGATLVWAGALPWTTLAVNALGCAAIGVLMVVAESAHPLVRPFLGAGVLGGFTTFSAYALDVHELAADGRLAVAATYLVLTPLSALAAVWAATALARRWR